MLNSIQSYEYNLFIPQLTDICVPPSSFFLAIVSNPVMNVLVQVFL